MEKFASLHTGDWRSAWAAGFFEGEGAVACARKGHPNVISIQIWQNDPWTLNKMQEIFGGTVAPILTRPGQFRWHCHGDNARYFVKTLRPLLSPKRQEQIDRAMRGEVQPRKPARYKVVRLD